MNEDELPPDVEDDALIQLRLELGLGEEEAQKALEITRRAFKVAPDGYQRLYYQTLEQKQREHRARAQAEFELAQLQGELNLRDFDYVTTRAMFKRQVRQSGVSATSADRIFDAFLRAEGIDTKTRARLTLTPEQTQKLRAFTGRDLTYRHAVGRAHKRRNGE